MKSSGKKWLKREIKYIEKYHNMPLYKWIQFLPGRSPRAIYCQASKMGYKVSQKKENKIENNPTARWMAISKEVREKSEENQNGCWVWMGSKNKQGYGSMRIGRETILAHRASWEMHNGPIPEGYGYHGTVVMHKCDNPSCINPNHLMIGTQSDNMKDMSKKGRNVKGKDARQISVLNNQQVSEIKSMLQNTNTSIRSIAKIYNVSHNTIWLIKQGRLWRYVE